ncbi:TonB-dependent receptor [Candidatus Albibeggiatoa sp. nov. BB20]|uniref:TonB-dependent receptor plug domain-containing protein n=1 Tax=Candidatus Albibeggiatoa sp. nov. BB20 TaxID=3162723 RepID=UPI003365A8AB
MKVSKSSQIKWARLIYSLFVILIHSPLQADDLEILRLQQQALIGLNLTDLLNMEVTSASKKPQKLSESANAIFVITQDDIRRSGATHVADVLRMVPGLQVSKVNSSIWRVSARGSFNGLFVNKLLVLVDGRSVYNMQIAGTFWDSLDVLMEDIEQIEVIRGPGGALWGANAVNGIINIITKSAQDTQGYLMTVGAGTVESGFTHLRYGGELDENTAFRIYGKTTIRGDLEQGVQPDRWNMKQTGFRIDSELNVDTELTLQADFYDARIGDVSWTTGNAVDSHLLGKNILARWTHDSVENSKWTGQFYYDFSSQARPTYGVDNHILDFELQNQWRISERQEFLWGLGYRWLYSKIHNGSLLGRALLGRHDEVLNGFIQSESCFYDDKVRLIIGTKLEHNDYTGIEVQPNIRFLWHPTDNRTYWAAISRSVRTPAQVSYSILASYDLPPSSNPLYPIPANSQLVGNNQLNAEFNVAYELGFRQQWEEQVSWDSTLFYNDYKGLITRTVTPIPDLANGRYIFLSNYYHGMDAKTYGFESNINWINSWGETQLSYHFINIETDTYPHVVSAFADVESETPEHQISLRHHFDLGSGWESDWWLRYVSDAVGTDNGSNDVDSYISLDIRLAWQVDEHLELSVVGQNLLDNQHPEFYQGTFTPLNTGIPRSIYGQVRLEF